MFFNRMLLSGSTYQCSFFAVLQCSGPNNILKFCLEGREGGKFLLSLGSSLRLSECFVLPGFLSSQGFLSGLSRGLQDLMLFGLWTCVLLGYNETTDRLLRGHRWLEMFPVEPSLVLAACGQAT